MTAPALTMPSFPMMELPQRVFRNLLIQVPGVLLLPAAGNGKAVVPEKLINRSLRTSIWFDYETGKLSSEETIRLLQAKLPGLKGLPESDIRSCLTERVMAPAPAMVQMLDALQGLNASIRLFCVSNVSQEEHRRLQDAFPDLYSRFQGVFTSGELGMRQPALAFLRHVVDATGILPAESLFVDCSLENVVTARSLGMAAVVVGESAAADETSVVREIVCHFRDAHGRIAAADKFLQGGMGRHPSLTSDGVQIRDVFSWFQVTDVLGDPDFLPMQIPPSSGLFCFCSAEDTQGAVVSASDFSSNSYILAGTVPPDLDTTSLGLSVLHRFHKVELGFIHGVLDRMLQFLSDDGILQVYFDHERARVDPVVVANALFLFHLAGRAEDATESEAFIHAVLRHHAYLDGTLYYELPESFLFAVSRLVYSFPAHFRSSGLKDLLVARLLERTGVEGSDALSLAMRMIACSRCGLKEDSRDRQLLSRLQNLDGSWDVCPITRYGSDAKSWIGNQAVTTAFALAALQVGGGRPRSYRNVVFDMGGVLFSWKDTGLGSLSGATFKKMLQSDVVQSYETGHISTSKDLHQRLADRFSVPVAHVDLAFARAVESLAPIPEMVQFVQDAKTMFKRDVRLFCMSNIGMQHWQHLLVAFPDCWDHFDGKFPSWASGLRKPDTRFFQRVILEAGILAEETIFIDDTPINVDAAVSLGCAGILHKTSKDTLQQLVALLH